LRVNSSVAPARGQMDVGARAVHVGAWIAAAAAHAGVGAWALWAALARPLDDAAPVGLVAHPAAAHWCALRLVWVVFAGEIAAALLAAAAAATHLARPGLSARGMHVFFWAEHALGSTALAAAFLAWTGVADVSALLAAPVAAALAPAALLAVAELLWAAAALRRPARWDRGPAAHAAWAALAAAGLLALAAAAVYAERAWAAGMRGDAAGYAAALAALLAGVTGLPVAWTGLHRAADGYFTPAANMRFGGARTAATAALRVAAAAVLLAAFLRGARDPAAAV